MRTKIEKLSHSEYLIMLMVDYYILNLASNAWSWMLLSKNVVELRPQLTIKDIH